MADHFADRLSPLTAHPTGAVSTRRPLPAAYPLAALCALALCASGVASPYDATHGPVVCPFRLLTGLPCPGCGMTRAWVFLAHGRLRDAIWANPFALVAMPAAAVFVVVTAVSVVRRRPPPDPTRALQWPIGRVMFTAWIVFGVVRALAVLAGYATV